MDDSYEAIIIGAGISGICAAYRLREALPDANFTILEGSDSVSGTWSFWKYPGFRCDSYMTSYGLPFYKWPYPEGIVPGDQIASYLCDAVKDLGLSRYIKFRHFVESATWSSDENRWSLCVKTDKGAKTLNASFVLFCPGYYDYKTPFQSPIPGLNNFQGQVVHPQFWPDDLSYSGKRIILIGSGATAITLLPALAQDAEHITMLQRSPSYVMAVPATRPYDKLFHTWLPKAAASWLCHWIHLSLEWMFVKFIVAFPNAGKSILFARMKPVLPSDLPMDPHFTPKYKLFEQRLGMCPDGDFFTALRQDNVQLVTDHIETVTATGVRTKGGKEIEADFIITATGLKLAPLGGIPVTVDGEKLNLGDRYLWHGCMIEGVPNAGAALGYFDSSWTKGVDTGAMKLASLMGKLRQTGHAKVTPTMAPGEKEKLPALTYLRTSATYVVQSGSVIPKVSDKGPWTGRRNWILDRITDWWYGYVGLKFEGRKDKEA